MSSASDIGEFLTTRRARITPERAGLPAYGRQRRVSGLRREEVAMLAGISVEYYVRLERGNAAGVSESVLEAVSRALQLDEAEHDHLFDLARNTHAERPPRRGAARPAVRPSVARIVDSISGVAALVRNGRLDVLHANPLAAALYSELYRDPVRPVNSARFAYLDPRARLFYVDWEKAAHDIVAQLRGEAGRDPYDRGLSDLIGELSTRSEEFRVRWAAHDVRFHRSGIKRFRHPLVGELTLSYEGLELLADPGLTLVTYSAEPGSTSAEALRELGRWSSTRDKLTSVEVKAKPGSWSEAVMRVVVIGASGHLGTYLVPRLVAAGHEVVAVSRGQAAPYRPHAAWATVEQRAIDRMAADAAGTFGAQIGALRPDAVIDLICFTLESAQQLVEALRGRVSHFLSCGTIWVHGPSAIVPTTEAQPRKPFGEYGIQKAAIEAYLLEEARRTGFPATVIHPGHLVGPGWAPLNPAGHFNPAVFTQLAAGEELVLPNLGLETVHHVHADDVAQAFERALAHWGAAVGESFHAVSPAAVTLRGYAEAVGSWFGKPARLSFLPWPEWRTTVAAADAESTWDHIAHSPSHSIAKAERLLEYRPRYSSLEAIHEAVDWLIRNGQVQLPVA